MEQFLRTLSDQTVNGLVIGNVYALIAVGLALIFGVSNLINFAQGSVFMVGAYIGWVCITWWGLPLGAAFLFVALACAFLGILIERLGLRPLRGASAIAPLLATIGISFVLDQIIQLLFSRNPHAFPSPLPAWRIQIGGVNIGAIDLMIAAVGIGSALALFLFLRYSRLGWAMRATAQDRDAAKQMGVDVDGVNRLAFALASLLGGVAGMLVGIYFSTVYPTMSYQAGIKGFAAVLLGGLGNIPGAIAGGLLLGLVESYGVALVGPTYRNLFAFIILIAVLVWRPLGIFARGNQSAPEPVTGAFLARGKAVLVPAWVTCLIVLGALALPLFVTNPYFLQVLTNAWIIGMVTLSVTLITGTAGQASLGQAGFVAIGAYASALLTQRLGWRFEFSLLAAAVVAAIIGTVLVLPAFRLRAQYIAIATLAIGEIVNQVILNWAWLTGGAMGITRIAPPTALALQAIRPNQVYWYALTLFLLCAVIQRRLVRSPLGRTLRALRDDDVAAQSFGVNLNRYKSLVFVVGGFIAGISGAFAAHMYSYINHETFGNTLSILALTMAILGGLGNVLGAAVGAVGLTVLPELLRGLADFRYLFYGLALVLLIRFRPQGILGTD